MCVRCTEKSTNRNIFNDSAFQLNDRLCTACSNYDHFYIQKKKNKIKSFYASQSNSLHWIRYYGISLHQ